MAAKLYEIIRIKKSKSSPQTAFDKLKMSIKITDFFGSRHLIIFQTLLRRTLVLQMMFRLFPKITPKIIHFKKCSYSNSYPISFLKYIPSKDMVFKTLIELVTASCILFPNEETANTLPPFVSISSPLCFVPA